MTYGQQEPQNGRRVAFQVQGIGRGRSGSENAATARKTRPARQPCGGLSFQFGGRRSNDTPLGHLSRARMVCRANERGGVVRFSSGKGVKGRNPGWRGPQRSEDTGRDGEGEARPLTPLERPTLTGRGQEKQAKRRAACTPDDRGRLAPLPSGKGRGGWERVAHLGSLFRAQGDGPALS